jgi:hypothetical protein
MTTELMDLEEELPRRERRRLITPVGVGAVAVAVAAAGFFGGVQVQKSRGDTGGGAGATAGGTARFAGARQGGLGTGGGAAAGTAGGGAAPGGASAAGTQAGAGAGAGQAQGGGATVGSVSSVDGKTLYVDDSSGNTVRVRVAKGGTVTRTAKSDAAAIHPGDTVIVQGETASSGTVVASTIRATASDAAGAAFGRLGGFGGSAAPGAQGTSGGG